MPVTPDSNAAWRERFDRDGFAIIERVLTADQLSEAIAVTRIDISPTAEQGVLRRRGEVYGMRDLIWRIPEIRRLAASQDVIAIARAILGESAFVVRGLFFDKTLSTNWNLPWHQDLTIAVRARSSAPGFGPWTKKAGVPHVHAPDDLLARMVTIRLHLDDCGPESGPLRVLPSSHTAGRLDAGAVAIWSSRARERAVDCLVPAGGAVVMRPLVLHASASGTAPGHRRVIHFEYAAESLPAGLEWYTTTTAMQPATIATG